MQRKAVSLFAIALIIGIGVLAYFQGRGGKEAWTARSSEEQVESYAASVVAEHGGDESCWTIIDGSVYDLTSWISAHPGGAEAILKLCGTDGSAAFNAVHGEYAEAKAALNNFKIGNLEQ